MTWVETQGTTVTVTRLQYVWLLLGAELRLGRLAFKMVSTPKRRFALAYRVLHDPDLYLFEGTLHVRVPANRRPQPRGSHAEVPKPPL